MTIIIIIFRFTQYHRESKDQSRSHSLYIIMLHHIFLKSVYLLQSCKKLFLFIFFGGRKHDNFLSAVGLLLDAADSVRV